MVSLWEMCKLAGIAFQFPKAHDGGKHYSKFDIPSFGDAEGVSTGTTRSSASTVLSMVSRVAQVVTHWHWQVLFLTRLRAHSGVCCTPGPYTGRMW
jgi:hypothetical protein